MTLLLIRQTTGNDDASKRLRRIVNNIVSAAKNENIF